jgi:phage shock protein C
MWFVMPDEPAPAPPVWREPTDPTWGQPPTGTPTT